MTIQAVLAHLAGVLGATAGDGPVPTTALVRLLLDETSGTTAKDAIGLADGTLVNMSGDEWANPGLEFAGGNSNGYVELDHVQELDNLPSFTIACWITPHDVDGDFEIISKQVSTVELRIDNGGVLRGGSSYGTLAFSNSVSGTIKDNVRQHVVLVHDGDEKKSYLFKNGQEVTYDFQDVGAGNRVDDSANPFIIGARKNNQVIDREFDGVIEDVRIYGKAMSPEEVSALYKEAMGTPYGLIDFGADNHGEGADRHYRIPHADVLDLNITTGWAWGLFITTPEPQEDIFPTFLASGEFGENNSANFYLDDQGPIFCDLFDDQGRNRWVATPEEDPILGGETLLVVYQYNATAGQLELYICPIQGEAELVDADDRAVNSIVVPDDWYFGRDPVENDFHFTGKAGGLWKLDRAATAQEIEAIAAGESPDEVFGENLVGWWPFKHGPKEVELDQSGNGNHATRHGTDW